ncbi:MAG: FMN-binding protein [Candidatus Aminicenantes bacterium]|nr:FMN-binding protein [Candidatus Aminicenantes bacterium]MDH5383218.1 FMN-binding protein [Candidatus Aminicenantes bacterium]
MSLSSRMIIVLTAVGLISGGFLAGVAKLTKERIAFNIQKEIEEAIVNVIPGTVQNQKLYEEEDLSIYGGQDESGQSIGYAVQSTGIGFQDKITLMFGINVSLTKIIGLAVIDQKETPGLGAKIRDWNAFLQFWENRNATGEIILRKPPAGSLEELSPMEINTITGATISSKKVLEIVNFSLERLRELQKEGRLEGKPDAN